MRRMRNLPHFQTRRTHRTCSCAETSYSARQLVVSDRCLHCFVWWVHWEYSATRTFGSSNPCSASRRSGRCITDFNSGSTINRFVVHNDPTTKCRTSRGVTFSLRTRLSRRHWERVRVTNVGGVLGHQRHSGPSTGQLARLAKRRYGIWSRGTVVEP